jgi:hypothetical protein
MDRQQKNSICQKIFKEYVLSITIKNAKKEKWSQIGAIL